MTLLELVLLEVEALLLDCLPHAVKDIPINIAAHIKPIFFINLSP